MSDVSSYGGGYGDDSRLIFDMEMDEETDSEMDVVDDNERLDEQGINCGKFCCCFVSSIKKFNLSVLYILTIGTLYFSWCVDNLSKVKQVYFSHISGLFL